VATGVSVAFVAGCWAALEPQPVSSASATSNPLAQVT
jgi:hypothetical protein